MRACDYCRVKVNCLSVTVYAMLTSERTEVCIFTAGE